MVTEKQYCMIENLTSPWILTVTISLGIAIALMTITTLAALKKVKLFGAGRQSLGGGFRGPSSPR